MGVVNVDTMKHEKQDYAKLNPRVCAWCRQIKEYRDAHPDLEIFDRDIIILFKPQRVNNRMGGYTFMVSNRHEGCEADKHYQREIAKAKGRIKANRT